MKINSYSFVFFVIGILFTIAACNEIPVMLPPIPNNIPATPTPLPPLQSIITPSPTESTVEPQNLPTGESGNQDDQLETYIVSQLAGGEKQHRYVILVTTKDPMAPLPMAQEVIKKCWLYKDDLLNNCLAENFLNSVDGEKGIPWNYSYVIISVISENSEFSQATVRLDEISGPSATKGLLYKLIKVNGDWQIESRKIIWLG